jgi:tricorn protease-like protein
MFLFGSLTSAFAEPQGLDYKRFGSIATAIVTADYPGQQVVEYKYEGRAKTAENKVTDSFRFEVMVNGKKQFVTVRITHDNQEGKELTIKLEEEK